MKKITVPIHPIIAILTGGLLAIYCIAFNARILLMWSVIIAATVLATKLIFMWEEKNTTMKESWLISGYWVLLILGGHLLNSIIEFIESLFSKSVSFGFITTPTFIYCLPLFFGPPIIFLILKKYKINLNIVFSVGEGIQAEME